MFKSNQNPMFRSKFSEDIFNQKYKHEGCETWAELCATLVRDVCTGKMPDDDMDQLIQYMTDLKCIAGGRYLYYAGRKRKFLNNCYLLRSEEDSREDWAYLSWKAESCLMTGGGIGNDYSIYRARDNVLHGTGGKASGAVSKAMMINEIGRHVMQGGSRRSAIYASLNHKHGDITEFLAAKDWHHMKVPGTEVTYAQAKMLDFNFNAPLDMTNISVNYDTEWLVNFWKTGQVGDVFKKNIQQALATAEPGFSFNFFDKERETLRNACVAGETEVLTAAGYVPIRDTVNKITRIWNGERWADVTPFETGEQDLVRVNLTDGSFLDCTWGHRWCVDGSGFVETSDLKVGNALEKFDMPVVGMEVIEVMQDAYSQGFYSGDGTAGYNFSYVYEPKYPCVPRLIGTVKNGPVANRVVWTHGPMLDKAFVPTNLSMSYRLSWLAGLLDADGTVTRDANGSGFQIGSIDHAFLDRVRLMLTAMGVRAKVVSGVGAGFRAMPDGHGGEKDYYCQALKRLLIGNTDAWRLMAMGLPLLRLEHNGQPPQRDARRFVRVASIVPLDRHEMTYCFTEPLTSRGTFNGIVTGQCTEVTSEDDSDVCNLGSMNMSRIDSLVEFADIIRLFMQFLICGSMVADVPYVKIATVREKNRRIGLGLMGIHEWLVQRGHKYEVVPELHKWLYIYKSVSDDAALKFADKLGVSRPVARRAIAPTGTIGILAGTTTGIEPIYSVAYKRRFLKGVKWHYQFVVDGAAQDLIQRYGADPETLDSALSMAGDYERRIKFQADIQDYVDMAISSTINLPAWGSEKNNPDMVEAFGQCLAKYAHRLRGFTVYPDGARGGQPLTPVSYKDAVERLGDTFEENVEMHDICDISQRGGSCGV